MPDGQSLQCVAPVATPVPSLSLLDVVVKCPALQVLHDDPPVFVWYFPGTQGLQVWSLSGLDQPAGQSLQYLAPSATPVPSLSLLELVVKCPALQVLHDNPPVFVWYFPDSQAVQLVA